MAFRAVPSTVLVLDDRHHGDLRPALLRPAAVFGGARPDLVLSPLARLTLLWSPFAAAVSTPASIYVGRIAPERAAFAIAVQVDWVLAMCVAALGLWKRVERRVVVQGG